MCSCPKHLPGLNGVVIVMFSRGSSHKSEMHTKDGGLTRSDCIDENTCMIQETTVQRRLIRTI